MRYENIILRSPAIKEDDSLLLDTSFLVEATRKPEVAKLLLDWQEMGCELLTIPEVIQELARGAAKNLEQYINTLQFPEKFGITVVDFRRSPNPTRELEDQKFSFYFATHTHSASPTDYKLCLEAFHYPNLILISGNIKDIPTEVFTRIDTLAIDCGTHIHGEYLLQFNTNKYLNATKHLKLN